MPQSDKQPCRPCHQVAAVNKSYPEVWKQGDSFRAIRGREGIPDWAEWCYLPLAAWYAIASGGGDNRLSPSQVGVVGILAALDAWRVTQGIYRFDPALFSAIAETPVAGDIPHEILYRLPEWCVYVETPGLQWLGSQLYGFFAHLEQDTNTLRPELRLLLDTDAGLQSFPLHLGPWSLAESITRMVDVARIQASAAGVGELPFGTDERIRAGLEPLISLLLYLCSQNAEIGDGTRTPGNPQPTRTKSGWRMFPPDKPTTWEVGVRIGAALRRAYHAAETGQGDPHAGPRAHIRRAHWHGFRSGPLKWPDGTEIPTGERQFTLKWLPPIPVNVVDPDDLPATVHPVRPQ